MQSTSITFALVLATLFLGCGSDNGDDAAAGGASSTTGGSGGTSSGGTSTGGTSTGGTSTGGTSTGGSSTGGTSTGGTGGLGTGGGGGTNVPDPAQHPLELILPRAAGTAPSSDPGTPNMPTGHRIFKAYPGIEYNIRAAVLGGAYPFTYALSNAPAGMTIDANSGTISWPNPSGTTVTPTITVTDAAGATQSSPWTITVTTNGFRFVDGVGGNDSNNGTLASAWRTLSKLKESGQPGEIVIFRNGTYRTTGMETDGGDTWVRVEMNGAYQPVQWLAYPGETPVFDNDYVAGVDTGRFLRFSGSNQYPVYLDGLEVTHAWDKGMQFASGSCDYAVFRRLNIHDVAEAIDGSNSAGIMTLTSPGDQTWYGIYQDIDFHDNAPGGIKQYSHKKLLWEDCLFRDSGGGPDLKADVPRFEVRNCSFYGQSDLGHCGLFGNMHDGAGPDDHASGEVRYNRMLCEGGLAMAVNQDGQAKEIFLYRNTFLGDVWAASPTATNGPFHYMHNVIVNPEAAVTIYGGGTPPPGVILDFENLKGASTDGITDANGNLAGTYVSYLGTRGYQVP